MTVKQTSRKPTLVSMILLLLVCSLLAVEKPIPCRVKYMIGTVKIRRGRSANWRNAKMGMRLRQADAIRTYLESRIELEFKDGTSIKIDENTTMELQSLMQNKKTGAKRTRVGLMTGKIFANVKKMTHSRSSFVFETPTATAAIRGTEVELETDKKQTKIRVHEGRMFVASKSGGKGRNVNENQEAFVRKGQKSVEVKTMDPKKRAGKKAAQADSTKSDSTSVDSTQADSTAGADTTASDSTAGASADSGTQSSSLDSVASDNRTQPLTLVLLVPRENSVTTGGAVLVSGKTLPTAELSIQGAAVSVGPTGDFTHTLNIPTTPGNHPIDLVATLGNRTKSLQRVVTVQKPAQGFTLVITSPSPEQDFATTLIPVTGITAVGAEVSVNGNTVPVSPTGGFNYTFYIPDESGSYDLEIESTLEGKPAPLSETRTIHYTRPAVALQLQVASPSEGAVLRSSMVSVRGRTTGREVTVNGDPAVLVNGNFTYNLMVSETRNWYMTTIEVIAIGEEDEISREISVTVDHTSPAINTSVPLLTAILPRGKATSSEKLPVSVLDNSPEDDIEFTSEVDGEKQVEVLGKSDRITVTLQEGMHEYRFYARDRAGNQSNVLNWNGALLSRRPVIFLRNPAAGSAVLSLPPNPQRRDFVPRYTLEFEIKNLPNEDFDLLKEVRVTNDKTSYSEIVSVFSDVRFEFDVPLARGKVNLIRVIVVDKSDNTLQRDVQIHVRP